MEGGEASVVTKTIRHCFRQIHVVRPQAVTPLMAVPPGGDDALAAPESAAGRHRQSQANSRTYAVRSGREARSIEERAGAIRTDRTAGVIVDVTDLLPKGKTVKK